MSESNISKESFINLYNQLAYDYKCIVLRTFKCLVSYKDFPEKGYKPYDIAGLIEYHQEKLNYSNQDVCNKVNELIANDNISCDLSTDNFYKIKNRNTQTSKKGTNFLKYIAQALEFDYEEYKKYLTEEGLQRSHNLITLHSNEINSIDTLYDLLSEKEKSAILQLTTSLLKLSAVPECTTEYLDYENTDTSD
ncbi:MAG: hypothetical protein J6D08_07330 [Lachnospiraceae bacterium]|nr:hypothetical protein [Lachnospiraceae bacterium]